jgi:hypothetical protein
MPLIAEIHLDAVLTNISQAFKNESLVATSIFPVAPVKKDSDVYYKYDKSNLRPDDTRWAPKTRAREVNWSVTRDGYKTERHALQELIEDDEKENCDSPLDVQTDTTEILTEKLLIRRELNLANMLTSTGNYDSDAHPTLAVASQWDNYASAVSDPNADIATIRRTVFKKTFMHVNTIVLPYAVYEVVREHPKVLERIKYTQRAIITPDILADLWDIENVIVAGSGQNTANEGQVDSLSYIWGNNVLAGYVEKSPRLKRPSWGYHIQSQPLMVERFRDDERKGEVVRPSFKEIPKIVTQAAGYLIVNPLGSP